MGDGREKERERNTGPISHPPRLWPNLQPRCVCPPGIQLVTLEFAGGMMLNHLSHTGQGRLVTSRDVTLFGPCGRAPVGEPCAGLGFLEEPTFSDGDRDNGGATDAV